MKSLVTFSFLLLSLNVFAICPDLQGDFTCKVFVNGAEEVSEISVAQSVSGANMTYSLTDHTENMVTTVVTNNQWQNYSFPEGSISLKAFCQANVLFIDGSFNGVDGTQVNFVQENAVLNSQILEIKTTSTFMGYTDTVVEICSRK